MNWKKEICKTKAFRDIADREMSEIEAYELLEQWRDECIDGDDPEIALMEICGLEPDYLVELIDSI
jgi:hypothetical protein